MTVITKAALAAELGITKARVSQYVKRGLPVRSDGKIDREPAVKWIAANHAQDGRPRKAGVNRAAAIVNSSGVSARLIDLGEIVGRAGPIVVDAAIALGMPVRSAFVLDQLVSLALGDVAEAALAEITSRLAAVEMSIAELDRQGERERVAVMRSVAIDELAEAATGLQAATIAMSEVYER